MDENRTHFKKGGGSSPYEHCVLCPRRCGADRTGRMRGYCGMGAEASVSRVSLHMWEEPCISGTRGSGTVFFSGCSLGCIYCQNSSIVSGNIIPGGGRDLPLGRTVTAEELAEIFFRLEEKGAHNVNLVTAAHFLPHVREALARAKSGGLGIPVVYNTSGYESAESLRHLQGLVDIYLTDFRYIRPDTASKYSRAPDYPAAAKQALDEMTRQGALHFSEDGMLLSGTLVRVLLLPGHVREACEILHFLHERYGDGIYVSLLSQYTPLHAAASDPLLKRKVTRREYGRLIQCALDLGMERVYIQEGSSAGESFIPVFDGGEYL